MAIYYPDLTTLDAVKRLIDIKDTGVDDERLIDFIHQASGIVQTMTSRTFVPYYYTHRFDALGYNVTSSLLDLDEDLLEVVTLTNGDSTTIAGASYILRPNNEYPKWRIELLNSSTSRFTYRTDWQQAIAVTGWWGFVPHYPSSYIATTPIAANLNTTATTITVDSVSSIETLDYIKIGSGDEVLQVTYVNPSSKTLTLARAQLGTTAESYLDNDVVYVYRQNSEIELAAARIARFLYDHRDTMDRYIQVSDNTALMDSRFPKEVTAVIQNYRRLQIQISPTAPYRGIGNF